MIRAIVVDDEKEARESVQLIISQFYSDEVEIVDTAASVKDAVKSINSLRPNLVFLDIEMPNENGLQLFDYFGESIDFEVVFITAYQQYATSAFRFAALDYLLKPLDYTQLGESIKRYKLRTRNFSKVKIDTFISNLSNELEINRKVVFPTKNGYQVVKMSSILFCKADASYSSIHTVDNSSFTIASNLKYLEDTLPSNIFFRCHKSFIVNMNFVKTYNRNTNRIILENGAEIELASRRVEQFMNVLINKQ